MTFEERFNSLPPRERSEVLRLLHEALLWRGWMRHGNHPNCTATGIRVEAIADVFCRNGAEIEEYT